jgi:5-methylcytosine-specific restriction protein A
MPKLKRLEPMLQGLKPRVAALKTDFDTTRRQQHAWRKWYSTARWSRLRMQCFERDLFTCQMCGAIEADTSKLIGDHVRRHNGDPDLFWDLNNLQCLCKPCHDREKQRTEAAERIAGGIGGV